MSNARTTNSWLKANVNANQPRIYNITNLLELQILFFVFVFFCFFFFLGPSGEWLKKKIMLPMDRAIVVRRGSGLPLDCFKKFSSIYIKYFLLTDTI